MKHLLTLLIALALPVAAQSPVDAMHARCLERMAAGSCAALAPVDNYTEAQLDNPLVLLGVGRVSFRDYLAVRGLGSISPSDTRMCDVARAACTADWNSSQCMVGRFFWAR